MISNDEELIQSDPTSCPQIGLNRLYAAATLAQGSAVVHNYTIYSVRVKDI